MATRQYIGARYVPKYDGAWNSNKPYEALTIVSYDNNTYTSKKSVPPGIEITNNEYWIMSSNFNSQLKHLTDRINKIGTDLDKSIFYVTPEQFGAVGDGVTDDTESIQRAIDYMASSEYKQTIIQFSSKVYLVKSLTINRDNIVLRGAKNNDNRGINRGTILLSARGYSTPFITVTHPSGMGVGGGIEDIMISGGGTRQDYNAAIGRIGLKILNRAEFNLKNVFISEFTVAGLYAEDWWDSVIDGLEIRACGAPTSKTTPALYLGSEDDSCNSLHFFGLHIEECPNQMTIDDVSSHIQFVASKFECGSQHLNYVANASQGIFIYEGAYAVTFDSCFFSNPEFSTAVLVGNNMTVFTGCQFAPHKHVMIKNYSANTAFGSGIVINACIFENVNSTTSNFVELGNKGVFSNNKIIYTSLALPLKVNGNNNVITGNSFDSPASELSCIDFGGGSNTTAGNRYLGRKAFSGINNSFANDNKVETWRIDATNSPKIDFTSATVQNVLCNNLVNFTSDNFINPKDGCKVSIFRNSGDVTLKSSMMADNSDYVIEPGKAVTICYIGVLSKWVIV